MVFLGCFLVYILLGVTCRVCSIFGVLPMCFSMAGQPNSLVMERLLTWRLGFFLWVYLVEFKEVVECC